MSLPVSSQVTSLDRIFRNQDDMDQAEEGTPTAPIPLWLHGSYVRVGPGKFDFSSMSVNHFYDGYTILSKFDVEGGKVKFLKRFLQSDAYTKAVEAKRPVYCEFSTPGLMQERGFFNLIATALSTKTITDNNNINMWSIEGNLFAVSEACHIHQFDKDTLATGTKYDLHKFFGVHMVSAHPIQDPSTGDLYNLGYSFSPAGSKYHILKTPRIGSGEPKEALKKTTILSTIYPSWATYFSYIHTFAMTTNYVILIEQPCLISLMKLCDIKLKSKPFQPIMEWCPQEKNRFFIIHKESGTVVKTKIFSETPFFFTHVANAYEDEGQIIIDLVAYPHSNVYDFGLLGKLRRAELEGTGISRLTKYRIPVQSILEVGQGKKSGSGNDPVIVVGEPISPPGLEDPCINPRWKGKKHRFVYGSGTFYDGFYANSLCRVDVETGESLLWREAPHLFPGDVDFVPKPDATSEDDGILISVVTDSRQSGKDFLLLLDGKSMKEIARVTFDSQIPPCTHGKFFQC